MMGENSIYKIFSVLIAIALAVYVNSERNPYQSRQLTVPLTLENQEPGTLIESAPSTVPVEVAGPRNSLSLVSEKDLKAAVNLKGRKAGVHHLRVVVVPVAGGSIPADVSFEPRTPVVTVRVAAVATRSRVLEPVFLRPAPSGFSYAPPVVQPSVAVLSGSREAVSRVARVEVLVDAEPSPGRPIEGRFAVQAVDAAGNLVEGVKTAPAAAWVRTELQRLAADKEVLVSPNVTGAPPPGYRLASVDIQPRSVLLTGNPDTLARINLVTTREVDISEVTSSLVRTVPILVPEGVTIQGSNRARIEVTVKPIVATPPARD